ncbi:hypothetical protein [Brevibacillus panacihumi]|uniref:Uncharacterized protein n=1 Tax=Brevibacillus panacihumi TaxID=497735 RepID=A0A3M8D0K1_9BACL|nr:hypothetical protein [Brevibacillus panacihumi]RNB80957.1 hypothetical protein EDM58_09020 [Brevibacillus panacihumi]
MSLTIKINNKCLKVDEVEVTSIAQSSLLLIGDAEVIDCQTVFDTPRDSLIISKQVPLQPYLQENGGE